METSNTLTMKKKKKNDQPNQEEDRISKLPDSVLVRILSFLEMDKAVKTGILSKRWEYLWTKVSKLVFTSYTNNKYTNNKEKWEQFIDFVHHTLSLHETNVIEKFYLHCDLFDNVASQVDLMLFASHVDVWVRFAVRRKVENLYLKISHHEDYDDNDDDIIHRYHYKLPRYLFMNDSIRELYLEYCIIDPPKPVLWNHLRKLILMKVSLSDNLIQNILSGTPLLEDLLLLYCFGVKSLNITSRNLKMLHIYLSVGSKLKITAPYVHKMILKGDIAGYTLTNVLSLVDVSVICWSDHSDDVNELKKLFESVRHAKYLSLDSDSLQVLSMLEVQNLHLSSLNCGTLSLTTNLTKWELPGIATVLRASSNVQMLIIGKENVLLGNLDEGFLQRYDFNEENYWSSLLQTNWLPATLITVKINDFKYGSRETELVEFLLKKAQNLQTMVLVCKEKADFSKDRPVTKDMWNFSQKLVNIRKASPDVVVQFS